MVISNTITVEAEEEKESLLDKIRKNAPIINIIIAVMGMFLSYYVYKKHER